MGVVSAVLYTIVVIIAILLIGLVLIQPSKGGGFGSAFGGMGESVFGAQTLSHLSRLTIILMSIFFALTLILAVISGHKQKAKSIVEGESLSAIPAQKTQLPAASATKPAAEAPAPAKTEAKPEAATPKQAAPVPAPAPAN